jgi:hypothetical protein
VADRPESEISDEHVLHSLTALLVVAIVSVPLGLIASWAAWAAILLGYASHLVLDLIRLEGVMLFWPLSRRRLSIRRRLNIPLADRTVRYLLMGLAVLTLALLLLVDLGQPPAPPAPLPSYGQALEQYYDLRGRNQVVASVEGTWQATGRRIRDRFEILNARGESLVMLDRFTGRVFAAGQAHNDDLYVNKIRLQTGSPVLVQAVEVHLRDESLASALAALYQMEREPGLQHIFVSGDVFLPDDAGTAGTLLSPSYAQTALRRIQPGDGGEGHVRLQYLTASDLFELAPVDVASADLIIVATYVPDDTDPTPTPLPSPPAPGPGVETKP